VFVNVEALLGSEELELPNGLKISKSEATSKFRKQGPSDLVFEV